MAQLHAVVNFQHNGSVYRTGERPEDSLIAVKKDELLEAVKLGKNKDTGKWLSPLLNHCIPADDEAAKIFAEANKEPVKKVEKTDEEKAAEKAEKEAEIQAKVEELRAEFDKIGKSYHNKWGVKKLTDELKKAKKEVGA